MDESNGITPPDISSCISPVDSRYWDAIMAGHFSAQAILKTYLRIELALIQALHKLGKCDKGVLEEVTAACEQITPQEVAEREKITDHDINAVVECICAHVSDTTKPFVHEAATSFDIRSTADILAFRDATNKAIIPTLVRVVEILIKMVLPVLDTAQVGRTHLRHAEPVTFGFSLAEYIHRLTDCILNLRERTKALKGKFSGATGAFNATSLIFEDPEMFEREVLGFLDLEPAEYSTQIVPPESVVRLMSELTTTAMVMSNLAEDIRILFSNEFNEFTMELKPGAKGSSHMSHKINLWRSESIISAARVVAGRMTTVHLNQESNFQRDLRDSLAGRTYCETFVYVFDMAKKLIEQLPRLSVNYEQLQTNIGLTNGQILSGAWNTLLRKYGHPNAHTKMAAIAKLARQSGRSLQSVALEDEELQPFVRRMTVEEQAILSDPAKYIGIANKRAKDTAYRAAEQLGIEIPENEEVFNG